MVISNEELIVILVVGLIAGWLAGQFVQGTGFSIIGDIIIGIIGAFMAPGCCLSWASALAPGIVSAIVSATIGAVVLLIVLRVVQRSSRW